jgi:hypothetical protein
MSNRMHVPTAGPDDWRRFLAEPEKQWRVGFSAHALAHAWEGTPGLSNRVRQVLDDSGVDALTGLEVALGVPEYQTSLPGGVRPSQTDLFVLARNQEGLVAIAVEGKVEESFGPLVLEWLIDASPGKKLRLAYLCDLLGLDADSISHLRYQLLHRTASALIEAERFHASTALMIVHSFSPAASWLSDYAAFGEALGVEVGRDSVTLVGTRHGRTLALGWVSDEATGADASVIARSI